MPSVFLETLQITPPENGMLEGEQNGTEAPNLKLGFLSGPDGVRPRLTALFSLQRITLR